MSIIYYKLFVLLPVLLLIQFILSGCSMLTGGNGEISAQTNSACIPDALSHQVITSNHLDQIMEYYDFLHNQTLPELTREYGTVKQDVVNSKSDENQIKYILLLSFPNTAFHDVGRALKLLNEWPESSEQSSNLNSFKNLLVMLFNEQQRMSGTIGNLFHKLKTERQRATALEKKVNDIKDMEKNLIRRDVY
ncbi:hypothetical protein SAMN05216419_1001140 [Nitrosomonas cryotolerans]|uniref:Uncharacterized protein n=1 Tax=Nitrosomonas cryotolerans ATCC 49181 TaxID=1131553 RepID=A0A1N6IMQ8_9PROT|nr:hypothetical protein [Nitrosomonas cryotolerans]SFP36416.1 hypothetical protein SAMN05216419_1001140 [Nitrosomonas cryotolerans]SIO33284.1 hypothetical protein SAMN02743940_1926 [Nitrosomonas cryotolerans ATCC 49181]